MLGSGRPAPSHVVRVLALQPACSTLYALQAPEDGTDVVTSAKRLLTSPGLNALGLKDRRDITRLVAQSALQVSPVYMSLCALLEEGFLQLLGGFARAKGSK